MSPQICHGPRRNKTSGRLSIRRAVCGAARRERGGFFSLSLSFNDPFLMIKLQECQKKAASASLTLSVFSGRVSLSFPVSLSVFKRCWSRCLRLLERPGRMGCAAPLSVVSPAGAGGMSWVAQHRDTRCFLPGSSSWRYFLPFLVIRSTPCPAGATAMGITVGKSTGSIGR